MPRLRTIKPEFWDDEKIAMLSRDARLVYIGLWNFSDDYGVVKGTSIWLKSKIFPYDTIQAKQFEGWMKELQTPGFIVLFQFKNENYYYLPNFCRHQVINKPSQTRNPEYKIIKEEIKTVTKLEEPQKDSGSTTGVVAPGVGVGREGKVVVEDECVTCEFHIGDVGFPSLAGYLNEKNQRSLEALRKNHGELMYAKAFDAFVLGNVGKKWKDEEDVRKHLINFFRSFEEKNGEAIRAAAKQKSTATTVLDLLNEKTN